VIPEFGHGSDDEGNAAAFLVYLVEVVGIAPNTANSYLSHAVKRAVGARDIDNNESVRTPFIKEVLRGLARKHDRGRPVRERTRVPLTYALV
jgi:hypothetical protein